MFSSVTKYGPNPNTFLRLFIYRTFDSETENKFDGLLTKQDESAFQQHFLKPDISDTIVIFNQIHYFSVD